MRGVPDSRIASIRYREGVHAHTHTPPPLEKKGIFLTSPLVLLNGVICKIHNHCHTRKVEQSHVVPWTTCSPLRRVLALPLMALNDFKLKGSGIPVLRITVGWGNLSSISILTISRPTK